jgi:hypothetical protein
VAGGELLNFRHGADTQRRGGGELLPPKACQNAQYFVVPLKAGQYSRCDGLRRATERLAGPPFTLVISWIFLVRCFEEERFVNPLEYQVRLSEPEGELRPSSAEKEGEVAGAST